MGDTAVLVIDMMNTYRHSDAEKLIPNIEKVIDPLVWLVSTMRGRDGVDLIYVNDSYGDFTADHDDLVRSALPGERPDLVKPVVPVEGCLFLEKVRHSAFYSTALEYLLGQLNTRTVVLTGQVIEQSPIDVALGDAALKMMEQNMHSEVTSTAEFLG